MVIKIDNRNIDEDSPAYIIAEAGSNHDGDYDQALKLIDTAVAAGADAVKFQIFSADKIAAKTEHNIAQLDSKHGKDLFELYEELEMPREWVPKLMDYCDKKNITFLSTPFDFEAVDLLEKYDVAAYKVASFELVHLPLIRHIAKTGKPIILSTGMATLSEIEDAVEVIREEGNEKIIILHCGISYPMPFDQVNINAMLTIKNAFNVPTGYSDHTSGIVAPILTVAKGGKVIEKHFTLDNNLEGPDHEFALNPDELKSMITAVRNAEKAKGTGIKKPSATELQHKCRGSRSLFINKDLEKGEEINRDDIDILRPGIGLKPKYLDIIVGHKVKKNLNRFDPITWDVI